ncbi:unnamed protein product, partial [Staurois parvus]
SRCCQVHSVSWVPVWPPIAAVLHRHTLPCATFRSPHTAAGFHFVIGCWQITASHCCSPGPNLPWAPVPPPHAAARSTVCHGSLYGLPLLLSPSPTLCHVPLSGLLTLLVGSICHRVLYGLPLLLPSTATLWLHTLVLAS